MQYGCSHICIADLRSHGRCQQVWITAWPSLDSQNAVNPFIASPYLSGCIVAAPAQSSLDLEERLLERLLASRSEEREMFSKLGQQLAKFTRMLVNAQLRPAVSSRSSKQDKQYRESAIRYYYGESAPQAVELCCMVTGESFAQQELTAGHIYRREWPPGILVSPLLWLGQPAYVFSRRTSTYCFCSSQDIITTDLSIWGLLSICGGLLRPAWACIMTTRETSS